MEKKAFVAMAEPYIVSFFALLLIGKVFIVICNFIMYKNKNQRRNYISCRLNYIGSVPKLFKIAVFQ